MLQSQGGNPIGKALVGLMDQYPFVINVIKLAIFLPMPTNVNQIFSTPLNADQYHIDCHWLPSRESCKLMNQRGSVRGGVYAPCSLRHSTPFSLLPSIFQRSLLFTNFHCSFFISLCSLLLFLFFLLLPDNFSCSLLHFPIFCCSLLPFLDFCAPYSQITFSLPPAPSLILGHAPCSLGYQGPFSLLPDYP